MPTYEDGKLIWNNTELGIVARYFAFEEYKKPYKCEKCNKRTRLEIHHKDKNRMNNAEDNLRVLCKYHHNEIHGRMIPNIEFKDLNPGDIIQLYVIEKRPITYIMEKYHCSNNIIMKILKTAGVPKRKSRASVKRMEAIKFKYNQ